MTRHMNLLYARLTEILTEDGVQMGRVRVGGALTKVPLPLVAGARPGDLLLVCDGVAIGRVSDAKREEENYVPGHSRQSH